MTGDAIKTTLLSAQIIANADPMLLKALEAPAWARSLGIFTTDCDDVSYVALDEATKKAAVEVVYARSMYAGAKNASTANAGEFIGILAGQDPEEVKSGLAAARDYLENCAWFESANEDDSVVYFAHCISRAGSYLASLTGCGEGVSVAYLIAPPMEAMLGVDAALKMAQTELKQFYGPPTETNFAGGLLTGDQAACRAACEAFAAKVREVAAGPVAI